MCFVLIASPFAQSIPLYLNIFRFPFGDLTDLNRFGLFNARNIRMTTKDGLLLKGYHLIPAHLRHWVSDNAHEYRHQVNDDELLRQSDRIIIYFHGNAATRAAPIRMKSIKQMSYAMNAHVVTFDYRGFGDSQGWPTEEGTYLDGLAAVQWVLQRFGCESKASFPPMYSSPYRGWGEGEDTTERDESIDEFLPHKGWWSMIAAYLPYRTSNRLTSVQDQIQLLKSHFQSRVEEKQVKHHLTNRCSVQNRPNIYLYGQSLGSGIASEVALRLNAYRPGTIQGVIYDAPFATALQAALTHPIGAPLRLFPLVKSLLMRYMHVRYANEEKVAHLGAPVLILHGAMDYQIPPENAQRLFDRMMHSTNTSSPRYMAVNFTDLYLSSSHIQAKETCEMISTSKHAEQLITHMTQYVSFLHAGHNDVHDAPGYIDAMVHFFRVVEKQRKDIYGCEESKAN
jgi:fermentation-respiration switch protein FrsA (DUF1100 family)